MCPGPVHTVPPASTARVTLSRGDIGSQDSFITFFLKIKGTLLGLVGKEMHTTFPISCLFDCFHGNLSSNGSLPKLAATKNTNTPFLSVWSSFHVCTLYYFLSHSKPLWELQP